MVVIGNTDITLQRSAFGIHRRRKRYFASCNCQKRITSGYNLYLYAGELRSMIFCTIEVAHSSFSCVIVVRAAGSSWLLVRLRLMS